MMVKIEKNYLEMVTYQVRGIQLLSSHLGERGFYRNVNICKQGEGDYVTSNFRLKYKFFEVSTLPISYLQ